MEIGTGQLNDLPKVAEAILKLAENRRVILFFGKMGVGKTTLIKEICLKLGIEENVSSPTFGIVNEYVGEESKIYHFDAYRLENEDEAYDIGVEEYLYSGNWCFIEWPEKITGLLPLEKELLKVDITEKEGVRTYKFI